MFIFHLEYFLSCKNFCKDDKKNYFLQNNYFELSCSPELFLFNQLQMDTIRNQSLSLVIEKWYGLGMSREKMHDKILSPKLDRFLNNEEFE
jgi:hypothetical protein